MTGKTDSYALCEIVRPLQIDESQGFRAYAFIVRMRGNKKSMRCHMLSKGGIQAGWMVSLTTTPVGGLVHAGETWVPKALLG
jgi:hypothetical protein